MFLKVAVEGFVVIRDNIIDAPVFVKRNRNRPKLTSSGSINIRNSDKYSRVDKETQKYTKRKNPEGKQVIRRD